MKYSKIYIEKQVDDLLTEAHSVRVNNLKQSLVLANQALDISKKSNDQALIAKSLSRLSFYCMINSEYEKSISLATEAAEIFESLNDEKGQAEALYNIASVYYKSDNLHMGLKYLLDCLTTFRKYNDYASQAKAYKSLGTIYEYFGDIEHAIEAYQSSVEAAEKLGDSNAKTNAFNPLSGLFLNQNNIEKATELIESSIAMKKESGDTRGLAFAYYGRGKIYTKTKQFDLAEKDFLQSIAIHVEMGERLGLCMAYQKMAVMFTAQQNYEKAKDAAFNAFSISNEYNMRMIKLKSSLLLYQVCKQLGKLDEALLYLEINQTENEKNAHNETIQIINSYNLIQKMEAKAAEDKMQLERTDMMEKRTKAEYAAKAKQEFLSNMSHEIRTPLNAVITITNLLKERADAEDQQLLDSLKFASDNLLMLINDILDFSKLEAGKVQLETKPVIIRELFNNIKNTYSSLAKEKGLELLLQVDEKTAEAYELDEIKLTQIIGNLLSNAIKFTERGSVILKVDYLTKKDKHDVLRLKVVDTGIGIPSTFLHEIFDSFSQPKSLTTKKQGGSGLGLAIVKKLVELHGSDITITTETGKGSIFEFDLTAKPAQQKSLNQSKVKPQLQGLDVLVVDDNKINILVVSKLLSGWGIQAESAVNGLEAVELSAVKKYDVILMDIHMPELNGYDAVKQIRLNAGVNAQTPVYALTADINANEQQEYSNYFNGFLRKPIEIDQLYKALSILV
jgi:signal transduction histidine kinase/CheY-like chemotaxis protein